MNVSSRFDVTGFGVIVTGGASGLGLAYGEVLAAHGARVTLIDVDTDRVLAEAERLQAEGLDVRGAYVHDLHKGARDPVPVDAAAIADAEEVVKMAAVRLRQRDYAPQPGPACHKCEVRTICASALA